MLFPSMFPYPTLLFVTIETYACTVLLSFSFSFSFSFSCSMAGCHSSFLLVRLVFLSFNGLCVLKWVVFVVHVCGVPCPDLGPTVRSNVIHCPSLKLREKKNERREKRNERREGRNERREKRNERREKRKKNEIKEVKSSWS